MKLIWKPITECDDDNGNHTVWSAEVNHPTYGKYLWISMDDGLYTVEYEHNGSFKPLVYCKSLTAAKRWATMEVNT
jgi:hypothetical protein